MKKRYFVIGISLILFIILTCLVVTNNISWFDDPIYNYLIGLRSDTLDKYFLVVTNMAEIITMIFIIIIIVFSIDKKYRNLVVISAGASVLINNIIKFIIRRERPDHLRLFRSFGYSYPSGHSMISVAVYGFLIYYVYKKVKNIYLKIFLIIILTLLIISIGLSRIYLGVHYPSDVLGGFLLAISITMIIITIYNNYLGVNIDDKTISH